ncbi:unnamed protein product [Rhizoctonia solani]|uniref:Pectate lyase n=1 Tax=Rhizoctonia solani TaxID=456999 RepID=A0A8H3EA23_9AGAM|nr:unnamed protein product [Rhizoctonia solani]
MTVKGTFDGGNVGYERGKGACSRQKEGSDKDAAFLLENGATLRNVVIGANQAEGVHCEGSCNTYNVWFEDVCEDAVTLRQTSCSTNIVGGSAKNANDKVVQHNGGGVVNIDSYCVQDFGKLYRVCVNRKTQYRDREERQAACWDQLELWGRSDDQECVSDEREVDVRYVPGQQQRQGANEADVKQV